MKTDTLTRDDMKAPAKVAAQVKTRKLYAVRRYVGSASVQVGFKMRLLPRSDALAVVRFLKARGVDAYAAAMTVSA
jgi:hypothetical protein